MKRDRSLWLATGLVLATVAGVVLGASALGGFSGAAGGDLAVASTTASTNLLLALWAVVAIGLRYNVGRRRGASKAGRRPAPVPARDS